MAFVHVKPKSQWKTVDISASLISGTNFNDLIELQELSDYELEEIDVTYIYLQVYKELIDE